ncbi:MAG: hypothetical protein K0R60_131 [Microbacterium sp.]|jgi:energy-coupling factor transporter ATP-binding protein EcfA2|nr:hypothetical protein [Microbacterium sp.]
MPTPLVSAQPADVVTAILDRFEFARTAEGSLVTIPRDPSEPYLATPVDELSSTIARLAWESAGLTLSTTAMSAAKTTLSAIAATAPARGVALRVAERPDELIIDLARPDEPLGAVRVTASGWALVDARDVDVPFRRTRASEPLPVPARGGSRDALAALLDLSPSSAEFRLVWGWLVGALFASTSRPLLSLTGPQGSGKSTRARMLKSILDPALGPTGREGALGPAPSDNERDNSVSAEGQFIPSWDNLSRVSGDVSDWFATLVTGAVTIRRRLFTDGDLYVSTLRRTGVLTAIATPLGLRADVLERIVAVELDRVPTDARRTESALWREFHDAHPAILGALLDDAVGVLANLGAASAAGIELARMADYHEHLIALDLHVGNDPRDMASHAATYAASVAEAVAARASDDPFTSAVAKLASTRRGWQGTATELRDALADERPDERDAYWPSGPSQTGGAVMQQSEALRALGVSVRKVTREGRRLYVLERTVEAPTPSRTPIPTSSTEPSAVLGGANLDDLL